MDVMDDNQLLDMVMENTYDADPLTFRLMCLEIYNRKYGIRLDEVDGEDHPWSVVLTSNRESLYDVLPRDWYFDMFINHGVHKHTGMDWRGFLDLPYPEANLVLDKTRKHNKKVYELEKEAQEKVHKLTESRNAQTGTGLRRQLKKKR